jgi:transposase
VDKLRKKGLSAICIDSRKMAAILSVRVNKTDDNDAQGIAEAMRCGIYHEVVQKSQSAIAIGTLMQSRRTLVQQKGSVNQYYQRASKNLWNLSWFKRRERIFHKGENHTI